jgi:2-polyprenyl-6-methoxyphenol hydroxylase-like FAD-dependent oxidoreductase
MRRGSSMDSIKAFSEPAGGTSGFGGRRAVVVGASMAGLATATVLARHFERVTVVDRDRLPGSPEARRSVPQGRHIHVLLGAGLDVIAELFPGIVEEMLEDGARLRDFGEAAWYYQGAWRVQFTTGIPMIQCSRAFLEHHVRRRMRALANIEVLEETTATGLRTSADGRRVAGVLLERPRQRIEELDAELVVDAGGRSSQAVRWLEAAGFPRPAETRIGVDLAYVSRIYRCPERYRNRPVFLILYPRPPDQKRAGIVYSVEGDRWVVSQSGYFGEHPKADDEGFIAFSRTLPRADIHELIKDAQPLTPPVIHKFPSDLRRHFEGMPRYLEGLLVIGDAACSFNPIFGQGMTVGCLGAKALDRCLREQPRGDVRGLAARFQRALASVTDLPWRLTTMEDLRYPEARGARPRWFGAMSWYTTQLTEMSSYDTAVYGRWLLVMHLLGKLDDLLAPPVVLHALWHAIRSAIAPLPDEARARIAPLRKEDPATRALLSRYFARVRPPPHTPPIQGRTSPHEALEERWPVPR